MKPFQKYLMMTVAALMVGAVAWGVTAEQRVDMTGSTFPMWIIGGLYVGSKTTNPTNGIKNKVTHIAGCTLDYDFPACTASQLQVSSGKAFTGASLADCHNQVKLGDPCFIGVAAATPSDAGSAYGADSIFYAVAVADDTIELRQFCMGADAGVRNAPDAGYNVRCISNQ